MEKQTDKTLSRRAILKGLALAGGASALAMPFIRPSYAATTLRVSNFGGFFEETFAKSVYPAFTKATGIELQSMPQAGSAQFLIQMAQAKQAGSAPMDVCIASQADILRGRAQGIWQSFDKAKLPNLPNIIPEYNFDGDAGLDGVGAMAWYISMIANPDEFETLPDSWTELWKAGDPKWGLQSGSSSVLLEIAAGTYFGGIEILNTEEGIDKVISKIAELKPNVKLWWTDEGSMQTAYQNDEVVGGMYFHDVSQIMKGEGTAIESIFPEEGAVLGFNAWALPATTTALEEAHAFVNWSCSPECHQLIARNVYAMPLIERAKLDLTDTEFAKVGAAGKPIMLAASAKVTHADYISQQFLKMVTA
jgi:putative spermidine/putrescine transport system substrate-binding protein